MSETDQGEISKFELCDAETIDPIELKFDKFDDLKFEKISKI